MGVACFVEEGRVNCYRKSVSISRMADSLARSICGMMSSRRIPISIEICDAATRKRSGNRCHVFFAHELNS